MRYLRTLWRALWTPPRGRHVRSNLRAASPDGGHPIPRPPALRQEPTVPAPASPPVPAPVVVDDPPLVRPYFLEVERRRAGRPTIQENHDLLAPDAASYEPSFKAPPVDLEDLAIAGRAWRELAGVGV
ncbi:hypothetical protein AB0I72_19045 [Nocardiopsis sp. NPDC049922]|uniref:hypothetical protein n=1 Tax=Nocardiopsis sp. NPDC049922 TaxID=3155157 RepID=UPI0033FFC65D